MLTLRLAPPARLDRAAADGATSLLDAYYARLWQSWTPAQRFAARALGGLHGAYVVLASLASPGAALRECLALGFDPGEHAEARSRVTGAGRLRGFVTMRERKGIHRLLNPAAFPLAANPLKNKARFADECARAGLPTPPTLAGGGALREAGGLTRWLGRARAVMLKPAIGTKGSGIRRASLARDGRWRLGRARLAQPRFERRLEAELLAGSVVQHALETHPELVALSPSALPTLRIVTCLDERGEPESAAQLLRLSAGGASPVDNFNRGNLVAPVGADAALGVALRKGRRGALREAAVHPASGARILGFRVPLLAESRALALRAHRHFAAGFVVIGWDVGLTAAGPVLIEGNWNHGTDIVQLATGEPLAETRLGQLYRHHLGALAPDAWRSAAPVQRERRR